jgi:hypothetical protein
MRAAEAAARGGRRELLHAVILLAMDPAKAVPFGAVAWQPRATHWIAPVLERARAASGALIVRAEIDLGKLRNFEADAAGDYMSVMFDAAGGSEAGKAEREAKEREANHKRLVQLVEEQRSLLQLLDHYLAVCHGGAASHPHAHRSSQREKQRQELAMGQQGLRALPPVSPMHRTGSMASPIMSARTDFNATALQDDGQSTAASTGQQIAAATEEVIRFDRRAPMRDRWRPAGDNAEWRGFVPQWTAEGGAHRIWKKKLGERAQLLHSFNKIVADKKEKPPELEGTRGKL